MLEAVFQNLIKAAKEFYPIFSVHAVHITTVFVLSPDDCEVNFCFDFIQIHFQFRCRVFFIIVVDTL